VGTRRTYEARKVRNLFKISSVGTKPSLKLHFVVNPIKCQCLIYKCPKLCLITAAGSASHNKHKNSILVF